MRLCRFSVSNQPRLGVVVEDYFVDLGAASSLLSDSIVDLSPIGHSMRGFLAAGEPALEMTRRVCKVVRGMLAEERALRGADRGRFVYSKNEVRLLPPIADPDKFLLLGLNYRDHVEETRQELPSAPVVFAKFRNAIVGAGDAIVLPKAAPSRVDYEAELAFVVGRRAHRVDLANAQDYIAGYFAVNDVTARNLQKAHVQWIVGKSADTFAPLGPYLVTRDEIADPVELDVRCFVNGELRQHSNTRNLIFDVPFLLHHLSQVITLEPGDIVSTGTPGGVGFTRRPPVYLKEGDIVSVEIDGIGVLENPVVGEESLCGSAKVGG